jgi:carboxypeptidase C (cathepsin A)
MMASALASLLFLQAPNPTVARPAEAAAESAEKDKEKDKDKEKGKDKDKDKEKKEPEEKPVVTSHTLTVGGRPLKYTVTAGMMPLKNEKDETEANVFFMAYVADRPGGADKRPLTFSFNGGPGSASVWLHLGALGPKRVKMLDDGGMPAPPYQLVDNEATWLDTTDLVFIDPVGTGYSRATKPELGKKFWGLQGDIESVGEFIRLYLTRYERWGSPLFLVGESYGTTRAAGLSGYLVERSGIAFNGILLVSSILNFQTARFTKGNDTPYPVFLPTYTAIAWYHKKLPADLQQQDLKAVLGEVRTFAAKTYADALAEGDRLSPGDRAAIADKVSRYTGLSKEYVDRANLRIEIQHFCKELLREEKRTVGRLDGRFKGIDESAVNDTPDFDPSLAAIRPPYTAMFNDYVRRELGYKSDLHYYILGGGIGPWDWGQSGFGAADTSEALRSAFSKNPWMRVFVASGHYDLATPFFATEYTLAHMGLDPSQRSRIVTREYEAGHMMYIHAGELARLKRDVASFIHDSLTPPQP